MKTTDNKQLTKTLRQIDSLAKTARIRMSMEPGLRTEAYMLSVFGLDGGSSEPIVRWNDRLNEILINRKQQVTKHYEEQRTEHDNRGVDNNRGTPEADRAGTTSHAEECGEHKKQCNIPDTESKKDSTIEENGKADKEEDHVQQRPLEKASVFKARFKDQKAELLTQASHGCDQLGTARRIFDMIWYEKDPGIQLIAQAGAGKTFVLGSVIKNLVENDFIGNCLSPWPILYVTKASVVEQTKGVLRDLFGLDTIATVVVINIEQLRSVLLGTLIDKDIDITEGEERIVYRWRKFYRPRLIVWDESQGLARADSTQSQIANALNEQTDLPPWETFQIDASATPWSRVAEAKHFAISSKKVIEMAGSRIKIRPDNWMTIARDIAHPSDPNDHCTAAIKRFVDVFEDRIVRIQNIRPKHRAHNSVLKIDFPNQKLRDEYDKAVETFEKKSQKIQSDDSLTEQQKYFAVLAEYTIFRKAAENCRRDFLAEWSHNTWEEGYAPGIGFSFKQTGASVCRILVEKYKWTRNDISIIWGGSTEALNTKKKIARKIRESSELRDAMLEAGISIEDDLGIYLEEMAEKTEDQLAFEKANNLLSQKPEEREWERLRFQQQISKVAMFSYKSGGVGLSLHHELIYPNARPRKGLFTPVYSEKELVQALGRFPRITSASDTDQMMCYYANTIEEHVAAKVINKLKCLREAIRGHESWEDIITKLPKRGLEKYEKHTTAADVIEELNTEAEEVAMLSGE